MNRIAAVLPLVLLLGASVAPARAQDATARRVTLDLNGVAPFAAFKAVASAIDVGVTVSPAVKEPVNIAVNNVTARTALNAMCESIGCRWAIANDVLAVTAAPQSEPNRLGKVYVTGTAPTKEGQAVVQAFNQELPAGLNFVNAPITDVGARLSEALGVPVKLTCTDMAVTTLTMDFSGLTLTSALQAIGDRETRPKASWQLAVGPPSGSTKPMVAVRVGPGKAEKR